MSIDMKKIIWGFEELGLDKPRTLEDIKPRKVDFEKLAELAKKTSHLFDDYGAADETPPTQTPPAGYRRAGGVA